MKKRYGAKSGIPYAIMNKLGYMRGSKETSKGRAAEKQHQSDYGKRIKGLGSEQGRKQRKRTHKGPTFAAALNRS